MNPRRTGLPKLFLLRINLALRSWRGRGAQKKWIAITIGITISFGLFAVTSLLFSQMARDAIGQEILPLFIMGALHAVFFFSLLRDTAGAMGHLFLARDTGFLLATPLGSGRVLALKILEATADAFPAPAGIALPLLLAYGVALGSPLVYFAIAPLVFLALLLITVSLGVLLSFALAPIAPVGMLRHWIGLASTGIFLVFWLGLLLLSRGPDTRVLEGALGGAIGSRLGDVLAVLPSAWGGEMLTAVARGNAPAFTSLVALVSLLAILTTVLFWLGPRFARIWQIAQVSARTRPKRETGKARIDSAPHTNTERKIDRRPLPLRLAFAFFARDRKLMVREPGMLTDIGVLLVMSAFLPVLIAPSLDDHTGIRFAILLGAVLFVSVELGFELGSRAFPLERFGMHWLLNAPLSASTMIGARLLSSWFLTLPAVFLVAGIGTLVLGQGPSQFLSAVSIGILLSGGAVPVGLATGVYLGRPDWRHPRQMLTLGGRLVLLIILMGLAAWFLLILILSRTTQAVGGLELSAILPIWGGLALFSGGMGGVSFWLAGRRLRGLEWLH